MKKLLLLTLFIFITHTQAKLLDAIAIVVEGEAITTAEIKAIQTQMNVSNEQARDLLIQNRLQKSAMNTISIDETSIDKRVEVIASQNNITLSKMQKILKQQGTSWSKYRSKIKESLKKEKFYQEHIVQNIPSPNNEELSIFYQKHKKEFTLPSIIHMIEYSTASQKRMTKFLQKKHQKGMRSRVIKRHTKDLNPTLLSTILQTRNNTFTPSFNAGDKFITYKMISKKGMKIMPFDTAKNAVEAKWKQEQQGKALKDYFEKLKTNANIQTLR